MLRGRSMRRAGWAALLGLFLQVILAGPLAAAEIAALAAPDLAGAICHSDPPGGGEQGPAQPSGAAHCSFGCVLCQGGAAAAILIAPPPLRLPLRRDEATRPVVPARVAGGAAASPYLSRGPPAPS
jgi:hypothetical protein